MSKLVSAQFATVGLGFAKPGAAQLYWPKTTWPPMSKIGYTMAKENADAQYKVDHDACGSLSGYAKDVCVAQAKGKDSVARADAQAAYENTPRARENARVAHVQASHQVEIE